MKKTKLNPVKLRSYKILDDSILIKRDGRLPRRCIITNQATTSKDKIVYKFKQERKFFNEKNRALKATLDITKVFTGIGSKTFDQEESISFTYYLCKELRLKIFFIKSSLILLAMISLVFIVYLLNSEERYFYLIIPISTLILSLYMKRTPWQGQLFEKIKFFTSKLSESFPPSHFLF